MPSLCSLSSHALLSLFDICGLSVLQMVRTHLRLHSFLANNWKQTVHVHKTLEKVHLCVLVWAFFGTILQCLAPKTTYPVLVPFGASPTCMLLAAVSLLPIVMMLVTEHIVTQVQAVFDCKSFKHAIKRLGGNIWTVAC